MNAKITQKINKAVKKQVKNKTKKNRRKNNRARFPRNGVNGLRQDTELPSNAIYFRKFQGKRLLSALREYQKVVKSRYLVALVHPDLAVKQQIPVKLYSDVPIPTASMGFHEQYQFTTSTQGTFLLAWKPNFLVNQAYLTANGLTTWSNITMNIAAGLTGNVGVAGNFFVPRNYTPNIDLQRYRLVSALLKISYNGAVLSQQGTMLSCATFDPLTVAVGNNVTPIGTIADTLVDRFGQFSLIQNGLWNTTVDITKHSEGIECLYVPTDPDDMIFQRTNSYYGTTVLAPNQLQPDTEGAHIQYIVCGRNLPVSSSCIIVDTYYNYEIIADPSSAPFLRSEAQNVFTSTEHSAIQDSMINSMGKGGAIRPSKPVTDSFWDDATGYAYDTLNKTVDYAIDHIPQMLQGLLAAI